MGIYEAANTLWQERLWEYTAILADPPASAGPRGYRAHSHSRRPSCLRGPTRISCSQPSSQTLLPGCGRTCLKTPILADPPARLRQNLFKNTGVSSHIPENRFSKEWARADIVLTAILADPPASLRYIFTYIHIYIYIYRDFCWKKLASLLPREKFCYG